MPLLEHLLVGEALLEEGKQGEEQRLRRRIQLDGSLKNSDLTF